jgi:dihydrofolate reductase
MRRLVVYNQLSLDGYFVDANGDMSWAHKDDPEWNAFVSENVRDEGPLLLGRVTYNLMAAFWPTPIASETMPEVAERMNALPKVVFSRTLDQVSWRNTRLVKGDLVTEVRTMKRESGPDMTILGSGSVVAQLAQGDLIDEYHIVLNPLALGNGRTMFDGIQGRLLLKLTATRAFSNGNVVLRYESTAGRVTA